MRRRLAAYEAATLLGRFGYVFTAKRGSCRFHLGNEFRHVQVDFFESHCVLLHAMECLRLVCFGLLGFFSTQ